MEKLKLGRLRLLLNFVLTVFGRKPMRVRFEVEWEELPWSFHCDYLTENRGHTVLRTGRRVKALPPE